MKWDTTKFFLANVIMPTIVGAFTANFINRPNCLSSWMPLFLPCPVLTFLIGAIFTALVLDIVMYLVIPKLVWQSKITIRDIVGRMRFENDTVDQRFVGIEIYNKDVRDIENCWVRLNKFTLFREDGGSPVKYPYIEGQAFSWEANQEERVLLKGKHSARIVLAIDYTDHVALPLFKNMYHSIRTYSIPKYKDNTRRVEFDIEIEVDGVVGDKAISDKSSWRIRFISRPPRQDFLPNGAINDGESQDSRLIMERILSVRVARY